MAEKWSDNIWEGRKVRLRAYEQTDLETMFRHQQDTEISRRDYMIEPPYSRIAFEKSVARKAETENDNRQFVIETLDGFHIGGFAIGETNPRFGTFCIGLGLAERSAWGKGYAKEAILLALRYMFHEANYQKCNLGVYSFNTRAIEVYERIGFATEGTLRRAYFSSGRYHDEVRMGMTREEFDEKYPDWRIALEDEGGELSAEGGDSQTEAVLKSAKSLPRFAPSHPL